jgi:hypothetical protein
MLSYRAWEIEALALRGSPDAAAAHLARHVPPLLAAPGAAVSERLAALVDDLLQVLRDEARPSGPRS